MKGPRDKIDMKYQIKVRVGEHSDWLVIRTSVDSNNVNAMIAHYKLSWRHVKAERIS